MPVAQGLGGLDDVAHLADRWADGVEPVILEPVVHEAADRAQGSAVRRVEVESQPTDVVGSTAVAQEIPDQDRVHRVHDGRGDEVA